MAYIKVDHSRMLAVANSLDGYVNKYNSLLLQAAQSTDGIGGAWQGTDYAEFRNKINTLTNSDSSLKKTAKSYQAFSDQLRDSAARYRDAQSRAVNRANNIPIY
jgi:uncharacterized protein YukE